MLLNLCSNSECNCDNSGYYKEMIVGELERNYHQIRDMHDKLAREEKED